MIRRCPPSGAVEEPQGAEARRLGPGDIVPADGEVVAGSATVDESALTGESAPVVREPIPGRQAVVAGTRLIAGELWVRPRGVRSARPARPRRGWARVWPVAGLGLACGLAVAAWVAPHPAWVRFGALVLLIPPYLWLQTGAWCRRVEAAFWRRQRVLPLRADALARAAGCDALVLPAEAAAPARGAVEFWPLAGVAVRDLAAAAQAGSLRREGREARSVVILAKQRAGMRGQAAPRQPVCGPVAEVAAEVAAAGGAWPEAACALEAAIAARGGRSFAVADGGRPLGLVEFGAAAGDAALGALRRVGVQVCSAQGAGEAAAAAAELAGRGRRVAMAWVGAGPVAPVHFLLAGTAGVAADPAALDLDTDAAKLPRLLWEARRLRRGGRALLLMAGATDAARALAAVALAWPGLRLLLPHATLGAAGLHRGPGEGARGNVWPD